MAKRKGVNKSEAIRAYLRGRNNAAPREVVAALKQKGIGVTPAFVSTIKSTSRRNGQRRGHRSRALHSRNGHGALTAADLFAAKQLIQQVGSTKRAKEALETLARLR